MKYFILYLRNIRISLSCDHQCTRHCSLPIHRGPLLLRLRAGSGLRHLWNLHREVPRQLQRVFQYLRGSDAGADLIARVSLIVFFIFSFRWVCAHHRGGSRGGRYRCHYRCSGRLLLLLLGEEQERLCRRRHRHHHQQCSSERWA